MLRCIEENVRPAEKIGLSETPNSPAVYYVLLHVIRKIKVKFKENVLRLNYNLNIDFILFLHLIKQFSVL